MSVPTVKLRTRWPILIALGVVGVTFALFISKRATTPGADTIVNEGETLFEILPSLVTQIDYENPKQRLVATRSDSESAFAIVVTDKSGAVLEQCAGKAPFDRIFQGLTAIRARRGLKKGEGDSLYRQYAATMSKLRVKDATAIGPLEWEIIVTAPERRVVAFDGQHAFEIDLAAELLDNLARGCSAFLGPDATPSASMAPSNSIPLSWVGKYSYTESCGRNVAGTGVVVEHVLNVRADGTGELDADGYQTMLRIPTTMVGTPDRLEVRFGGEGTTEMFGHDVLPGELLLVFRRASGSIVTDWNDYSSMCTTARTGKTFQRAAK